MPTNEERPGATPDARPDPKQLADHTTNTDNDNRSGRQCTARQLRRRRARSYRCETLDCGCPTGPHRDPLSCLCTFPPLTEHQLDGWVAAAESVLAIGCMPLVPIEVLRGLWRRGGRDRVLAEKLHQACGEVA